MAIRRFSKLLIKLKLFVFCIDFLILSAVTHCVFQYRVVDATAEALFSSPGYWFFAGSILFFGYLFGSYDIDKRFRKVLIACFLGVFASAVFITFVNYVLYKERSGIFGRGVLVGSSLSFLVLAEFLRFFCSKIFNKIKTGIEWTMFVDQDFKADIEADIKRKNIEGMFKWEIAQPQLNWTELEKIIEKSSHLVIGVKPQTFDQKINKGILEMRLSGKSFIDLAEFYERFLDCMPVFYLNPQTLVFSSGFSLLENSYQIKTKRLVDIILASVVSLLTCPIILLTAILIKISSKGPIFYSQIRTGKDGKPFLLHKFRSMITSAEANGPQWASQNDNRITVIGHFIRKTRIDELPQLLNILYGDMSFIGPRPERPEFDKELKTQIPYYDLRYIIRPGLTGWAQVEFPYGASIEDSKKKLQYEIYYIKNYSFYFDLLILLKTFRVVFFGRGR
jgi:exopolysaccharide biosynthesis polyprenyl glycosylphosphotransferase